MLTVAVVNPVQYRKRLETELLVDTGSVLTWISKEKLGKLGIRPRRKKAFRTIVGRVVSRKTGPAVLSYDSSESEIEVVFGEKEDAEVLGVTALESLGYRVDPVTHKLEHVSLLAI